MKYIRPCDHRDGRPTHYHPSQHQRHVSPINAPLYVVTAIQNPNRYFVRYKLYEAFEKYVADSGALLYTIELAMRDRHFEVTSPNNPRHIQLRSPAQLWHKENLLNIAINHLPPDWEYVAWVDADVVFARPDWVNETLHLLQHYHLLQLWSHAYDLGPEYQPINALESFVYAHRIGRPKPRLVGSRKGGDPCYHYYDGYHAGAHLWHPGYAWAARRSALSDLGGLGDIAILGSADHNMACALVGRVLDSIPKHIHKNYKKYWVRWQERADEFIRGNIGYMPGTLLHYWHGKKKQRQYLSRWRILVDNQFDPEVDILKDPQNLWQLTNKKPALRDQIRDYFTQRNEDSVDV